MPRSSICQPEATSIQVNSLDLFGKRWGLARRPTGRNRESIFWIAFAGRQEPQSSRQVRATVSQSAGGV